MKYRLLSLLKDPTTGGQFGVQVFDARVLERKVKFEQVQCQKWCYKDNRHTNTVTPQDCENCYNYEIIDGVLIAEKTGNRYPIVGGVPRILPKEIWQDVLTRRYPHFQAQYTDRLDSPRAPAPFVRRETRATIKTFGYQWTTFVDNFDYFREIFLSFTRPYLDAEDFKQKLVLEVGCGSGRPAVTACKLGAEVVAMDISDAVETAFQKSLEEPHLHVVQADAAAPPFHPVFDIVYSVGVLQHIADPRGALQGMATVVSERSPLILWVYGKRERWYQPIEWLRRITVHMPSRMLHGLSVVLAVLSELFLLIPYRLLSRIPGGMRIAAKIPGRIYARFPFRENVVGWFDRLGAPVTYYFEKDEIVGLLKTTGFVDVKITARKEASASWVLQARKL